MQRYNLSILQYHSHASLDPVNRARCPGVSFSFSQLFNFLGGTQVSSFFDDPSLLAIWNSIVPNTNYNTGLASAWRQDMRAGKFRGAPMGAELSLMWNGTKVPVLQCLGGFYTWENASARWHSYV